MTPLISIIIPHFNSGELLAAAVKSVHKKLPDAELLVMDGGSTDGSIAKLPEFVELVSEPDKGIYDAMNKGIARAKGTWVYFMGADDTLHPELNPSELIKVLETSTTSVVYGEVESQGVRLHGQFDYAKLVRKTIPHQAMFYRREGFSRFGHFKLEYPARADYELNIRWFCAPESTFEFLPVIIAHYSHEGFSSTMSTKHLTGILKHYSCSTLGLTFLKQRSIRAWPGPPHQI